MRPAITLLPLAPAILAQQAGTNTPENHPSLPIQSCTAPGQCTTEDTAVVLDANWRWTHVVGGDANCFTGNAWNATACPDGAACAQNCALDGADYEGTYGITTPSPGALRLGFVTSHAEGVNVGSRTYLMKAGSTTAYRMFDLLNQEFTFDVDVSNLPCGLNGAVYFAEMDEDGGTARHPGNAAGAQYGTGYCDAQCPRDIKFINGEANALDWNATGERTGTGRYGTCCSEMDIWEANSVAAAMTPHPCSTTGQTRCETPDTCGAAGLCDKAGCDFNPYRLGAPDFYGAGATLDTTRPFTVVTQFHTADGTPTGNLSAITRFYLQDNKLLPNAPTSIPGIDPTADLTDAFCAQQKWIFNDENTFQAKGGLGAVGAALARRMVLVLSVWDDAQVAMNWLDSAYPSPSGDAGASGASYGVVRGTCDPAAGVPATLERDHPDASVTYANIRVGAMNSTFFVAAAA